MQQLTRTSLERPTRPVTILQFGSGNFLRGFADWMVQQANDAGLTNHGIAIAYATKLAPTLPKDKILLVNLSGRGDKDMHTVAEKSGIKF